MISHESAISKSSQQMVMLMFNTTITEIKRSIEILADLNFSIESKERGQVSLMEIPSDKTSKKLFELQKISHISNDVMLCWLGTTMCTDNKVMVIHYLEYHLILIAEIIQGLNTNQ